MATGQLAAGQVDLAFLGEDKLREWSLAGRITGAAVVDTIPLDCKMVLAGPKRAVRTIPTQLGTGELLTVATSYPKLLGEFACRNGLNVVATETPSGGCEAFPASGRTDLCFDVVQSGSTLAANDLVVYREGGRLCLNVLSQLSLNESETDPLTASLQAVTNTYYDRLREARLEPDKTSYSIELLRDQNRLVKKLGEEFAELLQAALRRPVDKTELTAEAADVLYAVSLMLACSGISILEVLEEDIRRNT